MRKFFVGYITVLFLLVVGLNIAAAAPTLTSVSVVPNPALISDTLTISAVGSEATISSAGGQESFNALQQTFNFDWVCQSFTASETGYLNSIGFKLTAGLTGLSFKNVTVYDFISSTQLGAVLARSPDLLYPIGGQTVCGNSAWQYVDDFNESALLTAGVNYFMCGQTGSEVSGYSQKCVLSPSDGNYLYEPGTSPGTTNSQNRTLTMDVRVADNEPVRLVVKLPGGDYDSGYFARSEYFSENPWLTTIPPIISGETTIQAKLYGETTGWSSEIQIPFSMIASKAIAGQGIGIYIQAIEETDTFYRFGTETEHNSRMHQYSAFSANTGGGFVGRIRVDGGLTTTCNYEWDCQTDLNVGTHQYALYSTIGNFLYVGNFTVDINTTIVKIYVPITYNVFDIYEDESETSLVECNNIYSIDLFGDVANINRISASLLINGTDLFINDETVIPRNCYVSVPYNINPYFPFALPGYSGVGLLSGVEPMHLYYTDATGGVDCENGCLFGSHLLGGYGTTTITGTRSRQGLLNFYKLDAVSSYYPGSAQSWSGYVSQMQENPDDGLISPLVSLTPPTMNINSALYGDADYNPDDFGNGDDIYCETTVLTHGYTAYDVNILLLTDRNAIYGQYSFSPYKKYNSSLSALGSNGWGNIIWHNFPGVDHNGEVQCAFQVTTEIGYKSGWAYSKPRYMWGTNQSGEKGIGIIVRQNDGTPSQGLHRSTITYDTNKIDVLNYEAGTVQTLDSSDSPYTLAYGDNVVVYTGIFGADANVMIDVNGEYVIWHLNSSSGTNIIDSSGNDRNGTAHDMEDADWVSGKLGNALQFSGVNEYVDCGNIAGWERDKAFSIEFWINFSTGASLVPISRMSGTDQGWTVWVGTGFIHFDLRSTAANRLTVRTNTAINNSNWHHVVITYDGSSSPAGVEFYVDGALSAKTTSSDTLTGSIITSATCRIGANSTGSWFVGTLDEIILYESELTQQQACTRYNSGIGTETPLTVSGLDIIPGDFQIASKIFGIGRGDIFDISLYLPDYNVSNAAPVGSNASMVDRAYYSRVECRADFYDTWLDYTNATFRFWTNKLGSHDSPLCEKTTKQAHTTNCNPTEARHGTVGECFAAIYNEIGTTFLSECGEGNDCWVTENFSKADCVGLVPSTVIGYCSIELADAAGNFSTVMASAPLTVPQYQIYAICEIYSLVDGKKENVVYTQQDTGYIDCIVGLDNVLNPDRNFTITVEGFGLDYLRSDFDDYLEKTTHVFRGDITRELEDYAIAHSTNGETWEGEIPVFVSHQIYGSVDVFAHAAVTFEGGRYISEEDEPVLVWGGEGFFGMSQDEFEDWFTYGMNGLFFMVTNPVGWIQGNFFLFIILVFLVIILAPLALYGMGIAAKAKRGE